MAFFPMLLALVCLAILRTTYAQGTCGPPPMIEKSTHTVDSGPPYEIGTTVHYQCEYGYAAASFRRSIQCVDGDGLEEPTWTELDMVCTPQSCGDPGEVTNAEMIGSVFSFPNNVTYQCYRGYRLVGLKQRFCQTNGQWSGSLPTCEEIKCKLPNVLLNGKVSYDSLEYGSELYYECNKGFQLDLIEPRTCSDDGTWTGEEPHCRTVSCKVPGTPKHGTMDLLGGRLSVGSIVVYGCNSGYDLVGSGTSKCLDSGDWLFPPPDCIEPCTIPNVENGVIGEYVKEYRYRSPRFQKSVIHSKVKNGTALYLKCSDARFETAGMQTNELKISCTNGVWSHQPTCVAMPCRKPPPEVENAVLMTKEKTHGTTLTYLCMQHFRKTHFGSVTCEYGEWKGPTPACKDTRCDIESLQLIGLDKNVKKLYSDKEALRPSCLLGFKLKENVKNHIICSDGKWIFEDSPCNPAKCEETPPEIENGEILQYTENHLSVVSYKCDQGYEMVPNSNTVKCLFGSWAGIAPSCKDTRCYTRNLRSNEGMIVETSEPVLSRNFADISCDDGYYQKYEKPRCMNGHWTYQNEFSPCQIRRCEVPVVSQATFSRLIKIKKLKILEFAYDERMEYSPVNSGWQTENGEELYVYCEPPTTFSGAAANYDGQVKISCAKGKWQPPPICEQGRIKIDVMAPITPVTTVTPMLFFSSTVEPNGKIPQIISNKTILTANETLEPKPSNASLAIKPDSHTQNGQGEAPSVNISVTTENEQQGTLESGTESPPLKKNITILGGRARPEKCTCTYDSPDENLVAYSGNRLLDFGSEVEEGDGVLFHCKDVGYHRLVGIKNVTCRHCVWTISEFPICAKPVTGDAVMDVETIISRTIPVGPSGLVYLPESINVHITCHIKGKHVWPVLVGPNPASQLQYQTLRNGRKTTLRAAIIIQRTSEMHNGIYRCFRFKNLYDYTSTYLNIKIGEPAVSLHAPTLVEIKASTSSISLTWEFPPQLVESIDGYVVSLNESRKASGRSEYFINKLLRQHTIKNLKPSTEYMVTIQAYKLHDRSSPVSEIMKTAAGCSISSILNTLPEDIVINEDIESIDSEPVPVGTAFRLTCGTVGMRPTGQPSVTCHDSGNWKVSPPDIKCIIACGPISKPVGSNLRIDPEKDMYRFGESVALSCPTGQRLNTTTVRMMCLKDKWSAEFVPHCKDI